MTLKVNNTKRWSGYEKETVCNDPYSYNADRSAADVRSYGLISQLFDEISLWCYDFLYDEIDL